MTQLILPPELISAVIDIVGFDPDIRERDKILELSPWLLVSRSCRARARFHIFKDITFLAMDSDQFAERAQALRDLIVTNDPLQSVLPLIKTLRVVQGYRDIPVQAMNTGDYLGDVLTRLADVDVDDEAPTPYGRSGLTEFNMNFDSPGVNWEDLGEPFQRALYKMACRPQLTKFELTCLRGMPHGFFDYASCKEVVTRMLGVEESQKVPCAPPAAALRQEECVIASLFTDFSYALNRPLKGLKEFRANIVATVGRFEKAWEVLDSASESLEKLTFAFSCSVPNSRQETISPTAYDFSRLSKLQHLYLIQSLLTDKTTKIPLDVLPLHVLLSTYAATTVGSCPLQNLTFELLLTLSPEKPWPASSKASQKRRSKATIKCSDMGWTELDKTLSQAPFYVPTQELKEQGRSPVKIHFLLELDMKNQEPVDSFERYLEEIYMWRGWAMQEMAQVLPFTMTWNRDNLSFALKYF